MMRNFLPKAFLTMKIFLVVLSCCFGLTHSCTTIAVGKDASKDGSVFCSHSNDGEGDTDPRLVLIPASNWTATTAMRPIFYSPESFPRYVGTARASKPVAAYLPGVLDNGDEQFVPICEIPQVPHTYQYLEETYGAINEKQLGIAESTCSGVFGAAPKGIHYKGYGIGKACFSIDTLSQIAMERHQHAKAAIQEMGALAEQYGFYGAGLFEGTAESLFVTDKEEAWVFHILPDPTGASAIWAAQRIPDDSFAVVSNVFIIREIDPGDKENFLYSESVFSVAQELGWWSEEQGTALDFTATYSDGEYAHMYYSGRRSWGVFHLLAPSLNLAPEYTEWRISNPYPFAAQPDAKIELADIARAMRYFYQGTEYSQAGETSGLNLAGGPWKNPDHVSGGNSTPVIHSNVGNWERTIGLYRSSDTYISQSRNWVDDDNGGAVIWYGAYAAPYTIYTPFAAGMKSLPDVTLGHHMRLNKQTLFWANRFLGNYVQLKWTDMMKEVVAFQERMMEENLELQALVDKLLAESSSADEKEVILGLYSENAINILDQTWQLNDHLMFKYADGQLHATTTKLGTNTPPRTFGSTGATEKDASMVNKPGYPNDWLEAVGFFKNGPPPPPDCAKLNWKCGHKPPLVPFQESNLRGGDENQKRPSPVNTMMAHWHDYLMARRNFSAITAACHARTGDVAAALGECRTVQEEEDDEIVQIE